MESARSTKPVDKARDHVSCPLEHRLRTSIMTRIAHEAFARPVPPWCRCRHSSKTHLPPPLQVYLLFKRRLVMRQSKNSKSSQLLRTIPSSDPSLSAALGEPAGPVQNSSAHDGIPQVALPVPQSKQDVECGQASALDCAAAIEPGPTDFDPLSRRESGGGTQHPLRKTAKEKLNAVARHPRTAHMHTLTFEPMPVHAPTLRHQQR